MTRLRSVLDAPGGAGAHARANSTPIYIGENGIHLHFLVRRDLDRTIGFTEPGVSILGLSRPRAADSLGFRLWYLGEKVLRLSPHFAQPPKLDLRTSPQ
jgi:hypothetical protein